MDSTYLVPIVTMLAGIVVFVALAVWYAAASKTVAWSPWLTAGACLVAGGLIVCSGFS